MISDGMPVNIHNCRSCHRETGHVVLDLGSQPACDYFPLADDPGPDPVYPLQMWLCAHCGLAQLVDDPPQMPNAGEPVDADRLQAMLGSTLTARRAT